MFVFPPLWPCDTVWRHRSAPDLIMAWWHGAKSFFSGAVDLKMKKKIQNLKICKQYIKVSNRSCLKLSLSDNKICLIYRFLGDCILSNINELPDGILFHWFCKCTPPWMFLPLDIPSEYRPEHVTFGLLCVIFKFPSRIFCRRVPGFATDCPCGVWCRGLTTCLLYVGPPLEF